MTNICPFKNYSDIFGVVGQGIHKYRFMDAAIIDYALTIIIASITTYYSKIPLVLTTILWFTIAIILHMLFGVETNTIKYLGISC
jgi:hypothetical protein